jgi:predicted anti-sigma-YlaC factor YlaD
MTTMTCDEIQVKFDDRLDEQLAASDQPAFDAHLAGCAACRAEWQAYAAAWTTLAHQRVPEPSFGFAERTLRRLTENPPRQLRGWWTPGIRWALLGAAAVALGITLWLQERSFEAEQRVELYSAINASEPIDDLDVIAYLHELEGGSSL